MTGNGFDYDVIVIASGFGGSVAALRATEPIGAQGIAAIYTGGVAQDLDPRSLVDQLALSDQFLTI
jgi:hypothetical protein